jgi:hypothetical protein
MRCVLFLSLGVLEFLVAGVLLAIGWQLPGPSEVEATVGRLSAVADSAGDQVERLRGQLHLVRERRPQMQALADRLQTQMHLVTDNLRNQRVDFNTVQTVSQALGDVATGLDGLSDTLDPQGVAQVGAGLKTTAEFLDEKLAPAAAKAADQLEKTTADIRTDALRLSSLLRQAPLDLKAARQIHDSLGRFEEGLERMDRILQFRRLDTVREGFKGLETALTTGAEQVERLSGYTYPAVSFQGLKPVVDPKPFWPEGDKIAMGMRKAAKGVTVAGGELDSLAKDLPKLRESVDESRKVALATRQALAGALKQQETVEPLLKNVPEHAARLAEELPQLSAGLARVLRDTARLKEVAGLLRQAQNSVDVAVARWPDLRKNLGRSAVLLRTTQAQLQRALGHRAEYQASLNQTLLLGEAFSAALPLMTEQLETDLREQEQSLERLRATINEVNTTLPACSSTASRIVQTTRLLLALLGLVFGLHAGFLVFGTRTHPNQEGVGALLQPHPEG